MELYVNKLIDNLPRKKETQQIDLILDSGMFNGSYLIGASYFLKEMEKRAFIHVDRISGCSIGSFVALLYAGDCLDAFQDIYDVFISYFKKTCKLNNFDAAFEKLGPLLPDNICERMNERVFISYYNMKTCKKVVKSNFISKKDIFETIARSCFVPFVIDGNAVYKKKYSDGFNPFIFDKERNKQILFLDLYGSDKFLNAFTIKNQRSPFSRVLYGLLDIHNFYTMSAPTYMCSYVGNWSLLHSGYFTIKKSAEWFFVKLVFCFLIIQQIMPSEIYKSKMCKISRKMFKKLYFLLIKNCCF